MLILTRKLDEEIVLNSEIRIKILSAKENLVKIGIEAPKNVKILRGELFDSIKKETAEAIEKSKQTIIDVSSLKLNKLKENK